MPETPPCAGIPRTTCKISQKNWLVKKKNPRDRRFGLFSLLSIGFLRYPFLTHTQLGLRPASQNHHPWRPAKGLGWAEGLNFRCLSKLSLPQVPTSLCHLHDEIVSAPQLTNSHMSNCLFLAKGQNIWSRLNCWFKSLDLQRLQEIGFSEARVNNHQDFRCKQTTRCFGNLPTKWLSQTAGVLQINILGYWLTDTRTSSIRACGLSSARCAWLRRSEHIEPGKEGTMPRIDHFPLAPYRWFFVTVYISNTQGGSQRTPVGWSSKPLGFEQSTCLSKAVHCRAKPSTEDLSPSQPEESFIGIGFFKRWLNTIQTIWSARLLQNSKSNWSFFPTSRGGLAPKLGTCSRPMSPAATKYCLFFLSFMTPLFRQGLSPKTRTDQFGRGIAAIQVDVCQTYMTFVLVSCSRKHWLHLPTIALTWEANLVKSPEAAPNICVFTQILVPWSK